MNIKRVCLTAHVLPTHTHAHRVHMNRDELQTKLQRSETLLTHTFLVLKGICVLWKCSSRWAAPSHKGALALPILSQLQKNKVTNRNVYFCLLEPPSPPPCPFITIALDWTSKTNEEIYFCGRFRWNPRRFGRPPFPLSVLLQEYWLFTAHGPPPHTPEPRF